MYANNLTTTEHASNNLPGRSAVTDSGITFRVRGQWEPTQALASLLAKIAARIAQRPELVGKGTVFHLLTIAIDAGGAYRRPGMCHNANRAEIAFRDDGTICMLAEFKDYRTNSSGCWMGAYIPAERIESFARDWLEQTAPCDAPERQKAALRIDAMLRRDSCGRFRNLRQLVTTPGYTPTLRRPELADAYDAAQAARGDARRACR